MEKITINKRVYPAKEIDFNFLCELADNGIEINEIDKKFMSVVRVYVSYCMDVDKETAGNEINAHIIGGGTIDELVEAISVKMDESGFFRALDRQAETQTETPKKTAKKKGEEV